MNQLLPFRCHSNVVIIGGGFGGLYAARALRRARVRVTIVDRRNYHVFQPLLYQVAMAALSPGDIASPIRWILRRQSNVEVLLAEVREIDRAGQRLILTDGELSYDYLIVASGATHAYFGHDEWRMIAPGLKSLEDALDIRRRVLLAFEHAERETDPGAANGCSRSSSLAAGRRASRWLARSPRSRGSRWRGTSGISIQARRASSSSRRDRPC